MGLLRRPELALLALMVASSPLSGCSEPRGPAPADGRVPFAVLGDSDSHAYQDRISFPEGGTQRGGPHRAGTLQWTEVLSRLRGHEIDPGAWGEWGVRGRWAGILGVIGIERRAPLKQDHEFNYAWSGATCADLDTGIARQAPRLVARMDEQPESWRRGVVVIRIGINDLGTRDVMEGFARDGDSAANRERVEACLAHLRAAVGLITARHPQTAVLLVGVLDNVDWPRSAGRWMAAGERANIRAVLDRFDAGLVALAADAPRRAFFDDRAFYAQRVGRRGDDGRAAYAAIPVRDAEGRIAWWAAFVEGDAPTSLYLADGHAGTVLNAHWAQALTATLHDRLGVAITPISDAERDAFLMALPPASPAS